MSRLYLRPLSFLHGAAAQDAIADGLTLPLAGGPLAFTAATLIEGSPGDSKAHLFNARALADSRDRQVAALLQHVTGTRPAFAGLGYERPLLMGIVNVTPDSFSDGGLYDTTEAAVSHAAALARDGADIVDVGGESTRPGSDAVEAEEERARVVPVVQKLKGLKAAISIDTRKSLVAAAAAEAGVTIFNDVSALTYDPDSLRVAAEKKLYVVLMHAPGEPRTMQDNPTYDDVVLEVYDYLSDRIAAAEAAGIPRERIAADPGIGFGKTLVHILTLMANLSIFHGLGVPLLVGASRKRFIGTARDGETPRDREPGSQAAAIAAVAQGVQILRVHDIAGTRQALRVWQGTMAGAEKPL